MRIIDKLVIRFFIGWFNWYRDCVLLLIGKESKSGAYNLLPKNFRRLIGFITLFINGQGLFNIFQGILGVPDGYYHFINGLFNIILYYAWYRLSVIQDNIIAVKTYHRAQTRLARDLARVCMEVSLNIINDIHKNPKLSNNQDILLLVMKYHEAVTKINLEEEKLEEEFPGVY